MPLMIPAWSAALQKVDINYPPPNPGPKNTYYVLPEPALLVAPEYTPQRQLRIHHFRLLRDALLYRLGESPGGCALSSKDWREVLSGKVVATGKSGSKTQARTGDLELRLAPALRACGMDQFNGFPVPREQVPDISVHTAQEIIWEVAETNFRHEFSALD
ncbi:hypothetical protein C8R43DRAFT_837980, partial [Mycena crocata]